MAVSGRIEIGIGPSSASRPMQAFTDLNSLSLENNLDDGCVLSLSAPGDGGAGQLLAELATDLWIYIDGLLTQRFRVIGVSQTWDGDGRDQVEVISACYRRILAGRHIRAALSYSGISQGLILWGLVEHAQGGTNGDLGVTLGDPGPVVPRVRNYSVGSNILELIINLTGVIGGPTWAVNQNLEVIVSLPSLFPVRSTPIELGSTARSITRPSGAELFANAAFATGDDEATIPEYMEAPGLSIDPRGRWERVVSFPSVTRQTTLVEYAAGAVEESMSPAAVWSCSLDPDRFFGDAFYAVGDFVEIAQPRSTVYATGAPAPRVPTQVLSRLIDVDADGLITVTMECGEVGAFP